MSDHKGLSFRSLRSEAQRNLASRTTRAVLFGSIWFALMTATSIWDSAITADLVQAADTYQQSGSSTLVIEAEGKINGSQCEAMAELPNVRAAGALRVAEVPMVPAATPGVDLPTFDVTPQLTQVLMGENSRSNGVFLSAQVADAFGLEPQEQLISRGRAVTVAGIFDYPDDGRRGELGYSGIQTVPASGSFDQCWVVVWPESDRVRSLLSSSVTDGGDFQQNPPAVSQLNSSLGAAFDGESLYRSRPTAFLTYVLCAAGIGLGFVAVRLRKLELAAARLIGMRPTTQACQLLLESSAWLGVASVLSLTTSVVVAGWLGVGVWASVMQYAGVTIGAGVLGSLAGALLGVASINSARSLAYFRDR